MGGYQRLNGKLFAMSMPSHMARKEIVRSLIGQSLFFMHPNRALKRVGVDLWIQLLEEGYYVMANEIPSIRIGVVRAIVAPSNGVFFGIAQYCCPRYSQHGTQKRFSLQSHAIDRFSAAATNELQQHRFCLIIGLVCGQYIASAMLITKVMEPGVSNAAGGFLSGS